MNTYKAKDFNTRKALEDQIIADFGTTTDKKDAKISGTILQLKELRLSHKQSIWGVEAEASNYQVNNQPKVNRAKPSKSKVK
jgi:hypothetical protein